MVTPNNVLMSDSNNSSRYFSYISDKGVYEVSFNEDENSIIPRSENNIANTMDDFLTPIDFSKDLFSPIGNNKYKLLYGLDSSGLLMGLDPSIPFFDTYNSIYTIRNLDSVNITLNHEGDKITSAEITYDGRLFVYLSYQIKIEITDIGNTKVPFENATIKDYVIPTSWSTLDNGWYQNTNTLLECEIDNIPYLQVDWTTYIEENRSLVQSSPMEKEMADSLLSQYISSLESSSWAKTDDVYSDKTSTIFDGVYCKDGENVIVAVDEFTSSENYYLQVVFLPSTYFVLATSWEEVDSEWFKEINDYLGDDISGVPYIQGNWNVYTKEYDYYYAEIEFVSLAEYEEFVSNFMEEFENAGWFESEDYVDYWNSEMVYENDDYSFYIYIDSAANEERDDYYLIINFLSEDFDNEDIDWA